MPDGNRNQDKLKNLVIFIYLVFLSLTLGAQGNNFAVVELFTSEGCSSCPPAEKVFQELKKEYAQREAPVFFLAYHVDYWNRLGWKDPYSKLQFTVRQENYSRVLPSKELYTPQVVVNGQKELGGNEKEKIKAAINTSLSLPSAYPFSVQVDSILRDTLFFSYKLQRADKNLVMQVALTQNGIVTEVQKGENKGKRLPHESVVRIFSAINQPAAEGKGTLALKGLQPGPDFELLIFLQQKQSMKILAARSLSFLN